MSITTIKAKLIEKLEDMQTLKGVSNWETSNADGKYPLATVTMREGEGVFRSTAHNQRRRGFTIRVYQEQTKEGQGPQQAEAIVVSVIDELEAALDMDTTLSGTCKYVTPTSWRAMYQNRDKDTRVLEIHVDAVDLVSSN